MKRFAFLLVLWAAGSHLAAEAVTLRLCTDERSRLPQITPEGNGVVDRAIREAAREAGLAVEFYAAPTVRCKEEIKAGLAHGFPTVPFTTTAAALLVFPMSDGGADPARAVTSMRSMVYRRIGTRVGWDGKRFSHLRTPVLVPAGSVLLTDRLGAMKVPYDDGIKGLDASLAKLMRGRGDVAIGWQAAGDELLASPAFAGKLEALPVPFSDEPYYLGISRPFYEANSQQVERLWEALARISRARQGGRRTAR